MMGNIWGSKNNNKNTNINFNYQVNNNMQQNAYQNSIPNNLFQSNEGPAHKNPNGLRILNDKPQNKEKKTVAVIISFCNSSSYDNLFTTVEQKSIQGTKVEVYACDSNYIQFLMQAFDGKPKDQIATRLMNSIASVDPDCVVLNWECSSGYSNKSFTEGTDNIFRFLKKVLDRGHMTMFSDFSLKALVNQWNQKYELGPNPFVQTQEHTGNFVIRFKAGELKQCPSAQLQTVGDMAEQGMCNVTAAGGTIVYCVDSSKLNHNIYKLQVLTIVQTIKPHDKKYLSKIGQFQGSAGHVLLTYPSGGMILTSMGHWVQLMKIDTSAQKVFEVAEKEYGVQVAQEMRNKWSGMNQMEQKAYISSNAVEFVKNQAPCTNMYRKNR